MRYLFYLGHPAHFHLFRHVVEGLRAAGHPTAVVIKSKDVLEELVSGEGWPYHDIQPGGRRRGTLGAVAGLLVRDARMLGIVRRFRPDLMLGTSAEIAHVGRILGIPSIVANEDDHDVVPLFARAAYPFATHVLAPASCRVGPWAGKTIAYRGYHELAYLHPSRFAPDAEVGRELRSGGERYFILRFAALTAHHDLGRTGITTEVARRLIETLAPRGKVYITAERELDPEFEPYRIRIPPRRMHDALHFADLYIGDSQTMAAEAAVLGTPSLRCNDFVGQIGYLEELEHRYGLTYGIRTGRPDDLLSRIDSILGMPNARTTWGERRARMLRETIDVAAFITWIAKSYPRSVEDLHRDPDLQDRFRSPGAVSG